MIDVKNLQKRFGDLVVLDGIDLKVDPGDVIVLVGPSGCGKSTFLRCLTHLEEPTGGKIFLDGKEVTDREIDHVRSRMGMVVFSSSRNFTFVGTLTLGINSGAYVSEIIRGGLMAVDSGQMEAGRSLGLNYMTTMLYIIIPQAIKSVLPALGNEFIILLKDTSLITVIGGKELLYAAQGIMNRTYEAMFPLLITAIIYLILVMIFTYLLGIFERRLRQSDRR